MGRQTRFSPGSNGRGIRRRRVGAYEEGLKSGARLAGFVLTSPERVLPMALSMASCGDSAANYGRSAVANVAKTTSSVLGAASQLATTVEEALGPDGIDVAASSSVEMFNESSSTERFVGGGSSSGL